MFLVYHLFVLLTLVPLICNAHGQDSGWGLNDIAHSIFTDDTRPVSEALSELTKKASGEFSKLCHQLEGVLSQLTSKQQVKVTQPDTASKDCKCYCLCPQDTVESKVKDLRERVLGLGRAIKDKIHQLTAR